MVELDVPATLLQRAACYDYANVFEFTPDYLPKAQRCNIIFDHDLFVRSRIRC